MTRFGLQIWSQHTDWAGFRDAALRADGGGWDSVWTWDHLLAIFGPWEQPIFAPGRLFAVDVVAGVPRVAWSWGFEGSSGAAR